GPRWAAPPRPAGPPPLPSRPPRRSPGPGCRRRGRAAPRGPAADRRPGRRGSSSARDRQGDPRRNPEPAARTRPGGEVAAEQPGPLPHPDKAVLLPPRKAALREPALREVALREVALRERALGEAVLGEVVAEEAAAPVVLDLDRQLPVSVVAGGAAPARARVADEVRHCLLDDAVPRQIHVRRHGRRLSPPADADLHTGVLGRLRQPVQVVQAGGGAERRGVGVALPERGEHPPQPEQRFTAGGLDGVQRVPRLVGLRVDHRPPTPAWIAMTPMLWAIMSCSSREIRSRSAATARAAACSRACSRSISACARRARTPRFPPSGRRPWP